MVNADEDGDRRCTAKHPGMCIELVFTSPRVSTGFIHSS